jgi:hypothetical protein
MDIDVATMLISPRLHAGLPQQGARFGPYRLKLEEAQVGVAAECWVIVGGSNFSLLVRPSPPQKCHELALSSY